MMKKIKIGYAYPPHCSTPFPHPPPLPSPPDLLEKSRVISQQPGERCYHIFYQLLAGADQELLNTLLLTRQVKSYRFVENGEVTVDNMDDVEEFQATNVSGSDDEEE